MGLTADPASTTGIDCILVQGYMHMCMFEREGERLRRGLVELESILEHLRCMYL